MSGWIAIKRGISDHPIFHKRPDRLYVWMWMLETAAWKDTRQDADGKVVVVKRGQLLTSLRQISTATGVGVQVVRTLLSQLGGEHAVNTDATHGRLLITICNYEKYQAAPRAANTGGNTTLTHGQHTKGTREQYSYGEAEKSASPASLVDAVWAIGKPYLSGHGVKNPGGVVGRWLKDAAPSDVLAAIDAAQKAHTQDPVPYIAATLKPKQKAQWEMTPRENTEARL